MFKTRNIFMEINIKKMHQLEGKYNKNDGTFFSDTINAERQ